MAEDADRNLNRYIMRFPEGMRERLKEAAEANKRTLNAEIIDRLERSFALPEAQAQILATVSTLRESRAMLENQANTLASLAEKYLDDLHTERVRAAALENRIRRLEAHDEASPLQGLPDLADLTVDEVENLTVGIIDVLKRIKADSAKPKS